MALLRRKIELSMRPSDKGPEWFDPYDDLFDQYIDCDSFQLSDITIEPSSSDDLDNFFDISGSSNGSHNADTSSFPDLADEPQRLDEEDEWQGSHHYSKGTTALPLPQGESASAYPRSRGKAAASDSEVISLDDSPDLQLQPTASSSSTPVSPSPTFVIRSKKSVEKSYTTAKGRNPSGICKSPRKQTPRMMSPQRHRSGYQGAWARRIETAADKLNLQFAIPKGPLTNEPLSPPCSGNVPQGEYPEHATSQHDDNPWLSPGLEGTVSPTATTFALQNYSHLTPLQTPTTADTATFSQRYNLDTSYQPHDIADPSKIFSSPPPSARIAQAAWPQPSLTTTQSFDYSASPSLPTLIKTEGWWQFDDMPGPIIPPPDFQQIHVPLRNTMRVDMSMNGLMISCEPSQTQSPPFVSDPFQGPIVYPGQDYPHLPQRIPWRDRTPSTSPPPITPTRTRPSHNRSRSTTHRRSKSNGAHSRATSMGFVNFTPDDSRKILTGVAPSGSSKTKARREKEAAEKRRKLSEAAIRAVRDAGGDVERFKELASP